MELLEIINANFSTLLRCLKTSHKLLRKLRSVAFVKDRIPFINQQETLDDKNEALLTAMLDVPEDLQQSVMDGFIAALRSCDQNHVANIFKPESNEIPMSDEHYEMLFKQTDKLCKIIDLESGLLDELMRLEVITHVEYTRIHEKNGFREKIRELIDIILRKSDDAFGALLNTLKETGQTHVASILTGASDSQPLSDEHRNILTKKADELCKFLDPENDLLNKLLSLEVITWEDNRRIRSKTGFDDKVGELIDTILRKSDNAFQALIKTLDKTGQTHVIFILTGTGASRPLSEVYREKLREKREDVVLSI